MTTTTPPKTAVAARAVAASKIYGSGDTVGARARLDRRRVPARRVHRDHGPVRFRQVDAAALPRRSRLVDERSRVPRRHRPEHALRQGGHARSPRPRRVRLPDVQPHPDAHRDSRTSRCRRRSRGTSPTRRGSTASSTPSVCATASSTGRRSCRAVSSSASRSPVRSSPSPRSSSPTNRPETSTPVPAPRSSASCSGRCRSSARRS